MYSIVKSAEFDVKFKKILQYLLIYFSQRVANDYWRYLHNQLKNLEVFPYLGTDVNLVGSKNCMALVSRKNIVFYRVDEEKKEVHLLFIASANENYLNLLWPYGLVKAGIEGAGFFIFRHKFQK